MKLLDKIEKSKDFWFLLAASFLFFLLRLPSLFEPYWYGDEGITGAVATAIRNGRILYQDAWDNKPPLLYLLYAFFNSDQFFIRLASLILGVFTVIAFFFLAKTLFGEDKNQKKIAMISTGIFGFLFAIPLLEGNIANAENFMLLPIILSALLILRKKTNFKIFFFAGLILGIAFLFKIVAIFDLAAFTVFTIILNFGDKEKKLNFIRFIKEVAVKKYPIVLGFVLPILFTSLFFLGSSFRYFLQGVFLQNVGYVGYGNTFIIPQGFLILKILVLFGFIYYIYSRGNKFSKTLIFICIWLAFSLFNTFFSQRPYTHYLLVSLPSISLLVGLLVWEKKYKMQVGVLLIIALLIIFSKFSLSSKTLFYYQNFISFTFDGKSVKDYRNFFDRRTPIDYEVANYIKSKTTKEDQVFVWGNNAQLYKMTGKIPPGKYTVAYHITGYKDGFEKTQEAILKTNPKLIIIMPRQPMIPFSLNGYGNAVGIEDVLIYERIL